MFSASKSGQYQGYQISRSVRLRSSASAYFNRTLGTPTSGTTWTWSGWAKRGSLGSTQGLQHGFSATNNQGGIYFNSDALTVLDFPAATNCNLTTTQVFRDPSAWYHIVVQVDTTQATASNRVRIYVNGTQVTAFSTATYPTQNTTFRMVASGNSGSVGRYFDGTSYYFDGYLTEINFIDGQALTPSSFGAYNAYGVWSPMKYNGTYGTNGFYLNFSDNSAATAAAIGKDYSGNGNNWTPNNISVTAGVTYDSMLDVPTPWGDGGNGRGNYCVVNPFDKWSQASTIATLSEANLRAAYTTGVTAGCLATFPVNQDGKWYWEVTLSSANATLGVAQSGFVTTSRLGVEVFSNGQILNDGTSVQSGLASWLANDVIAFSYDASTRSLQAYRNNATYGNAVTISTTANAFSLFPLFGDLSSVLHFNAYANFGQRPFAYTPPSGFRALNTQNLPTPTIAKGNQYFDATTYTGNGSTQSITNSGGMQPDLVWIKSRSTTWWNHLIDSVRGPTKQLYSNATDAEGTVTDALTSFNSNGFSMGLNVGVNQNAATYVGWQWKAGGTPAVTNTAGSITSTVSAGATQGFSVVTYTGTGANATVGHGLGVAPRMIIVKNRGSATNWKVWQSALSGTEYLEINNTTAKQTAATVWNSTTPTSSVFSVGTSGDVNANGSNFVAYLFAAVAGYSAFGSYTGNGSADGPFVFTGFRPAFVLIKQSDAVRGWNIEDTSRNTFNAMNSVLAPQASSAESTNAAWSVDALSNGFKIRTSDTAFNASGGTYIFAAFAENPFKYSLAR